jgi:hypothetical protein
MKIARIVFGTLMLFAPALVSAQGLEEEVLTPADQTAPTPPPEGPRMQPAQISTLDNPWSLYPGMSKSTGVRVKNPTRQEMNVYVSVEDIKQSEHGTFSNVPIEDLSEGRRLSSWITLGMESDSFTLPPLGDKIIGLEVNIPQDPVPGIYSAWVAVNTDPVDDPSNTGPAIVYRVAAPLVVKVPGDEKPNFAISSIEKYDDPGHEAFAFTDEFPFVDFDNRTFYKVSLQNTGNTVMKLNTSIESEDATLLVKNGPVYEESLTDTVTLAPDAEVVKYIASENELSVGQAEINFTAQDEDGVIVKSESVEFFRFPIYQVLSVIAIIALFIGYFYLKRYVKGRFTKKKEGV